MHKYRLEVVKDILTKLKEVKETGKCGDIFADDLYTFFKDAPEFTYLTESTRRNLKLLIKYHSDPVYNDTSFKKVLDNKILDALN